MIRSLLMLVAAWLAVPGNLAAQATLLQSGPMVGYAEHREALLWVQTTTAATVQFVYWPLALPTERFYTDTVRTHPESAYTAKLIADEVIPGQSYGYEVQINGEAVHRPYSTTFQTLQQWKPGGHPPEFVLAAGSCSFINDPPYPYEGKGQLGGDYHIFESILSKRPDAMLWLGDNVYLREADWNTQTGIYHRYTYARSLPDLQALLASVHHYATWDDHDYGPDDSDRSFVHKAKTRAAFEHFWGNPSFGMPDLPGIITSFTWGDADFFVLDNRTYRSPQKQRVGAHTMLGEEQIEWLMDNLITSRATFKVVLLGSMFLNSSATGQNYAGRYADERNLLLRRIEEEGLRNVVFVTGDKHQTDLSRYVTANGNAVYDLSVSPLTATPNRRQVENKLRVEGTLVRQRNFATLHFAGPSESRTLTFRAFDSLGEELWSHQITAEID